MEKILRRDTSSFQTPTKKRPATGFLPPNLHHQRRQKCSTMPVASPVTPEKSDELNSFKLQDFDISPSSTVENLKPIVLIVIDTNINQPSALPSVFRSIRAFNQALPRLIKLFVIVASNSGGLWSFTSAGGDSDDIFQEMEQALKTTKNHSVNEALRSAIATVNRLDDPVCSFLLLGAEPLSYKNPQITFLKTAAYDLAEKISTPLLVSSERGAWPSIGALFPTSSVFFNTEKRVLDAILSTLFAEDPVGLALAMARHARARDVFIHARFDSLLSLVPIDAATLSIVCEYWNPASSPPRATNTPSTRSALESIIGPKHVMSIEEYVLGGGGGAHVSVQDALPISCTVEDSAAMLERAFSSLVVSKKPEKQQFFLVWSRKTSRWELFENAGGALIPSSLGEKNGVLFFPARSAEK